MATDGMSLWQSLFGRGGANTGLPRNTNSIKVLRVEQATNLVKHHRGVLQLDGLRSVTPTVAGILARYRGVIFLNGLTSLPVQVATKLAKHRGPLYLGGNTLLLSLKQTLYGVCFHKKACCTYQNV